MLTTKTITNKTKTIHLGGSSVEQAGAELCQAQEKLGLAKTDLPVAVFRIL